MDVFALNLRLKEEGAATVKAAIDKLNRSFDEASGRAKAYDMTIGSLKETAMSLASGFALGAVLSRIVTETTDAEFAAAQLNAALKSTKGVAGQSAEALNAYAAALSQVSIFDDDAITGAQSLLLTFTKIQGDIFPKATQAILNVATAMGTDLKSAAIQVGKALNDPILGVTALARSGIQFSESQKAMIKSLVESNQLMDAQKIILAELETQFGGSAKAASETFGGAIARLTNELGNLLTLSQKNSSASVVLIDNLTLAIIGLNDALAKLPERFGSVGKGFQFLINTIKQSFQLTGVGLLLSSLVARGKEVSETIQETAAQAAAASAREYRSAIQLGTAYTRLAVAAAKARAEITTNLKPVAGSLQMTTAAPPSVLPPAITTIAPGVEAQVKASAGQMAGVIQSTYLEEMTAMATNLAVGIKDILADSVALGIEEAIATGSMANGFKAMAKAMLAGLGGMLIQFGKSLIPVGALMEKVRTALMTLSPQGIVAAGLGMIAVGAALRGAAQAAFGGSAASAGTAASIAPSLGTTGGTMTLGGLTYGPTAAGSAATIQRVNPVSVTIIGPNDPAAQRQMQELITNANRRGSV